MQGIYSAQVQGGGFLSSVKLSNKKIIKHLCTELMLGFRAVASMRQTEALASVIFFFPDLIPTFCLNVHVLIIKTLNS